MSFLLSKLVWALLAPGMLLFFLMLAAWHTRRRHPRSSRRLLAMVCSLFALLVLTPAGAWLIQPLEARFPQPSLEQAPYGIIVLGGALEAEATEQTGTPVLNDAAERLTAFVALARQYPEARLVFSGGSGMVFKPEIREADSVKAFFSGLGLAPERVIFERESRNTFENAGFSFNQLHPEAGQRWLLVTSAWHMPRAVGCFRKAGWKVLPYPVDYRAPSHATWLDFEPDQQLMLASTAAREWLGLLSYRLLGRIDTLFPGPEQAP